MIIRSSKEFEKNLKSLKDSEMLRRIKKQIEKIIENPNIGKPLRYGLRGERTVYVKPYRLIYSVRDYKLFLLRFLHRKKVYK
ncbi:MAG: type II toxin-antitoxin system RelE/ParE family toxin [Candidatus Aenigmarchaeota archaeon]|nr:type II toxin-antitoxin system RelE/ParE family toxin [Candidatus Aenigmarchaeota archaeon]